MSDYPIDVEPKKIKGKFYGEYWRYADGRLIYCASRTTSQVFHKNEPAWAIDKTTLIEARARGVVHLCIHVCDTNDLLMTKIAWFFDPTRRPRLTHNYSHKGGSEQYSLPVTLFVKKQRGACANTIAKRLKI